MQCIYKITLICCCTLIFIHSNPQQTSSSETVTSGPATDSYRYVNSKLLEPLRGNFVPLEVGINVIQQLPENATENVANGYNPCIYMILKMHNLPDSWFIPSHEKLRQYIHNMWPPAVTYLQNICYYRSWVCDIPFQLEYSIKAVKAAFSPRGVTLAPQINTLLREYATEDTKNIISQGWDTICRYITPKLWFTQYITKIPIPEEGRIFHETNPPLIDSIVAQFNHVISSLYLRYPIDSILTHVPRDWFKDRYSLLYALLDMDYYNADQVTLDELRNHLDDVYNFAQRILEKDPGLASPPQNYPSPALTIALTLAEIVDSRGPGREKWKDEKVQNIIWDICELLYQYGGITPFITEQPEDFEKPPKPRTAIQESSFVQQFVITKLFHELYHSLHTLNKQLQLL